MYIPEDQDNIPKFNNKLFFSNNVSKIRDTYKFTGFKKAHSYSFSIPPAYTCPYAGDCINYCYAIWNSNFRLKRQKTEKHNYALLYKALTNGSVTAAYELIINSIPKNAKLIRINDSGDFFSQNYLNSWIEVSQYREDIIFYAYTKSLPYLYHSNKKYNLPDNLRFTISLDCNNDAIPYINKLSKLGFKKCYILRTIEDHKIYKNLPFNGGEKEAIYGSSDFKIAIPGAINRFKVDSQEYKARKFYLDLGKQLNIEVC